MCNARRERRRFALRAIAALAMVGCAGLPAHEMALPPELARGAWGRAWGQVFPLASPPARFAIAINLLTCDADSPVLGRQRRVALDRHQPVTPPGDRPGTRAARHWTGG
jgi:hypothetical protein